MVHTVTRAAVLRRLNEPLSIEEMRLPELLPGQVLVRVAYSGVCHTQLLEARGRRGADRFLPHTLGHEASGTVVDIGEGVTQVKTGDSVVLSWIVGAGREAPGPKYRTHAGDAVNAGAIATFSEFAIVAENRCTPLGGRMAMDAASVLGCAVATGLGIARNEIEEPKGKNIVVFGVGGIGLCTVWALRSLGAARIIAVDLRTEALSTALAFGASDSIDSRVNGFEDKIKDLTAGGADVAVDASGSVAAMESAFRVVKDRVGSAIIAGNPTVGQTVRIDPYGLIRGRRIHGTVGGGAVPTRDFPLFEEWLHKEKFPFHLFLSKRFRLSEVNEALDSLESGVVGRLMLEFP